MLHAEADDAVEGNPKLLEHLIEGPCLFHRPGKAIQDESVPGPFRLEHLVNEADHDFVRDEVPFIHKFFGLHPERGFIRDRRAKKVARGDVGAVELI